MQSDPWPTPIQGEVAPRTRRVLIADDHDDASRLFALMLQSDGWHCDIVADGEAAVRAALARPYNLILMDIRMPVLSGLDAIRHLRAKGLSTPVVAVTADAFDSAREHALEAGANDYLSKPVTRATLIARCAAVLARPGDPVALI